jgi:septal ring-binding cell division protein DamX
VSAASAGLSANPQGWRLCRSGWLTLLKPDLVTYSMRRSAFLSRLGMLARPAAILLLLASSAQAQAQLRPAIPLPGASAQPAPAPKPAANPTRAASKPVAAARASTGACLIRAGTFSQRANADSLAQALKPLGDVRVKAMQLDGKPVHLVTIAGLRTRKNAERTMARLNASGRDLGPLSITGCRT